MVVEEEVDSSQDEALEEAEDTITYVTERVKDLEDRCARYASANVESAKKVYALERVLQKHNISFDVKAANLKDLVVDSNFNVAGAFTYDPPSVSSSTSAAKNKASKTQETGLNMLTEHDIKGMTLDQINQNWDQISSLLVKQ